MSFRVSVWALLNGLFAWITSEQIYMWVEQLRALYRDNHLHTVDHCQEIAKLNGKIKLMEIKEELLYQRIEDLEDEYIYSSTDDDDSSSSEL